MNLLANFNSFIGSLSSKEAIQHKSEFDKVYNSLVEKATISLKFGDIPVDFKIQDDWEKLKAHSIGDIRFKNFYSKDNVVSAHNFWAANSVIFEHHHSNADAYIYLIDGLLEVIIEETKFTVIPDRDNPFQIPKGFNHSIKALETSVFVIKFVISQN